MRGEGGGGVGCAPFFLYLRALLRLITSLERLWLVKKCMTRWSRVPSGYLACQPYFLRSEANLLKFGSFVRSSVISASISDGNSTLFHEPTSGNARVASG